MLAKQKLSQKHVRWRNLSNLRTIVEDTSFLCLSARLAH